VVSSDESLDLPAAALRADQAEVGTSIEVLAATLEQALPQIASVERRKVGGFRSKRREVQRIVLAIDEDQFELQPTAHGLQCTRHKVVRGITLSRQELPLADWLAEVIAGVARRADIEERDRIALEGLLR
jgi:hypothetical protein